MGPCTSGDVADIRATRRPYLNCHATAATDATVCRPTTSLLAPFASLRAIAIQTVRRIRRLADCSALSLALPLDAIALPPPGIAPPSPPAYTTAMRDHVGRGTAPAKAILLGEHAVVYGWPAIAVPLPQMRAKAEARFDARSEGVSVEAAARFHGVSRQRDPEQPLVRAALLALQAVSATPSHVTVRVESTIPIAAGLGSGAAVSTAIMRAVADLFGTPIPESELSALVYEVEKIHHGTPSGIDNTVVVYGRPVYFRKGLAPRFLASAAPLTLLVADTGVASATREAVSAVRQARERDPEAVDACMTHIGDLAEGGRAAIEAGDVPRLGRLMNEDQAALAALGVSTAELDALVRAALDAGALGAKLTGAGRGGHAIALTAVDTAGPVATALSAAGAKRVTACRIEAGNGPDVVPHPHSSLGRV